MPLFMDVHHMDGGVSASDVAGAHQKDVETHRGLLRIAVPVFISIAILIRVPLTKITDEQH